ncbi:DUF397 domain-containing protein [Nonomuraea sp. NPDC050663]|uniref:DUF397 domain-containing protein n=1 Tax=Nonomuraea sp. NPDC050663 TaxID=3364370 RepID=UPI0037A54683
MSQIGREWQKSTYSMSNGECVEIARTGSAVHVRDSKDPSGPTLTFTAGEWRAFLKGAVDGEFDV